MGIQRARVGTEVPPRALFLWEKVQQRMIMIIQAFSGAACRPVLAKIPISKTHGPASGPAKHGAFSFYLFPGVPPQQIHRIKPCQPGPPGTVFIAEKQLIKLRCHPKKMMTKRLPPTAYHLLHTTHRVRRRPLTVRSSKRRLIFSAPCTRWLASIAVSSLATASTVVRI